MTPTWQVINSDVLSALAGLPEASVQTCITSPPYWGLRDYGAEGQIGLEPTPDAYVAKLVAVFREVRRVLRDDGTLWCNLGDSYHNLRTHNNGGAPTNTVHVGGSRDGTECFNRENRNKRIAGLKEKDLVGIPWRVAFALQADGWYLRSDIIWAKPNPMPESVQDRPTKAHEYIFLLTKRPTYYYDAAAIAEAGAEPERVRKGEAFGGKNGASVRHGAQSVVDGTIGTRNKRTVWTVTTQPYPEAHFATFPEALIEPCVLAGARIGDTVLDPFTGSGTTGAVAIRHQRSFVGVELNPAYAALARRRIGDVAPLLAREVVV